jgi:formylglycine-generating enzyme required for sulfatase activity
MLPFGPATGWPGGVAAQATYFQVAGSRPRSAPADRLPAETVSWFDAIHFCNALSEREHACRAGTTARQRLGMVLGHLRH